MNKRERFLRRILLTGVAGVDLPAHEHEGWLVMKGADPVIGYVVDGYEYVVEEGLTLLRKSTISETTADPVERAVESAFEGNVVRMT